MTAKRKPTIPPTLKRLERAAMAYCEARWPLHSNEGDALKDAYVAHAAYLKEKK